MQVLIAHGLKKLVEEYKSHPFKNHSAFTKKFIGFENCEIIRDYRVSYNFDDNKLTFKFLTRTRSRFKRKCKFTLKLS